MNNILQEIIICPASQHDFSEIKSLTAKNTKCMVKDINKGFIHREFDITDIDNGYTIKYKGQIIGAICVRDLLYTDIDIYDIKTPNMELSKYLYMLVIDDDFRKKGIATRLYDFIKYHYKGNDLYGEIVLGPDGNKLSENFHKSVGFNLIAQGICKGTEYGLFKCINRFM